MKYPTNTNRGFILKPFKETEAGQLVPLKWVSFEPSQRAAERHGENLRRKYDRMAYAVERWNKVAGGKLPQYGNYAYGWTPPQMIKSKRAGVFRHSMAFKEAENRAAEGAEIIEPTEPNEE